MLSGGRRGRRGAIALEAAITLPIMTVLFVGAFDVVNALTAWRQTRAASIAIAEAATNMAVQTSTLTSPYSGSNLLTSANAYAVSTAVAAYLPDVRTAASSKFAVTLTAITFASVPSCSDGSCVCVTTTTTSGSNGTINTANSSVINGSAGSNGSSTTSCYTANVAWSVALGQGSPAYGGMQTRKCGVVTPVAVGTASSLGTSTLASNLPQGLYGPYSLLVADVSYTFTPSFLTFITGPVTFLESSYVPPRIGAAGEYVQYSPNTSSSVCSGYV